MSGNDRTHKRARKGPLVLCILDGWGYRAESAGNAIAAADAPNWRHIAATYPHVLVEASGEFVGLPKGIMGNSEVGHINIGSGRVVPQGVVVINDSLADGSFATNPVLQSCLEHVRKSGGRLHFFGLLSDGSVHSSIEHLFALVDAAAKAAVPIAVHAFGDGRDVPPSSMQIYVAQLEAHLAKAGTPGAIASVSGRFYAMDRDKRWERVEKAYRALAEGKADHAYPTAAAAIDAAYSRGETDEFIVPTLVGEPRPVRDGDAVVFFNFRPDRARELTLAFSNPGFHEFPVHKYANFVFATMTQYDEYFPNPVLFGPRPQADTFGEVVAAAGLSQLRLAETEKYAHVTYFFNGGREDVFAREDRLVIPSNRTIPTYDLAPEMRAAEITTAAVEDIKNHAHDVIVMNYANADMVGHTGVLPATISAIETLDVAFGRLEHAILEADGILAITADHGNAEDMVAKDGSPITAHTTEPVPLILVSREPFIGLQSGGKLGDIAPTLLPLLGLETPAAMTGKNLLAPAGVGAAPH
jgi:2,3-bisphosphoglycerate-independent phosphoglycerate mutase